MSEINLDKLKELYKPLTNEVKPTYTPFAVKISNGYVGKTGVLFVGKAENMENRDNKTIDYAFSKSFSKENSGMNTILIPPTGKAAKSSFSRVLHLLAKKLEDKGINSFARTNLYKLSTTKTYAFNSEFNVTYLDIFKEEIAILQPKYVIMLTSGMEKDFLKYLGAKKDEKGKIDFLYKYKGNDQKKEICRWKIKDVESIFITAFHPQGKPETELVEAIMSLIQE